MNLKMYDRIFDGLERYMKDNSIYGEKLVVLQIPSGDVFPKVIVEEISNVSYAINDPHSLIGFEINIYTQDEIKDDRIVASIAVARELEQHVSDFMESVMKFKRIMAKPTPNIDKSIYRITMQYTTISSDTRCCFF